LWLKETFATILNDTTIGEKGFPKEDNWNPLIVEIG
jgi:hypothetical protein